MSFTLYMKGTPASQAGLGLAEGGGRVEGFRQTSLLEGLEAQWDRGRRCVTGPVRELENPKIGIYSYFSKKSV